MKFRTIAWQSGQEQMFTLVNNFIRCKHSNIFNSEQSDSSTLSILMKNEAKTESKGDKFALSFHNLFSEIKSLQKINGQ
jgi:hypothetical protein